MTAPTTPQDTGRLAESMSSVINLFEDTPATIAAAFEIAQNVSAKVGMPLFGGLAALTVTLMAIRIPLEKDSPQEVIGELINGILRVGLFLFFMQQYRYVVGDGVHSLFQSLAVAVGGGAPVAGFRTLTGMLTAVGAGISKQIAGMGFLEAADFIFNNALNFLLLAFASIVNAIAAGMYIIMFYVGDILAAVAVGLGPFFIAFGVFHYTSKIFESWLDFLMQALMYKVVAAVLVFLISKLIASFVTKITTPGVPIVSSEGAFAVLMVSLGTAYLMHSVPSIASGLMRGSASAGGGAISWAGAFLPTKKK